MGKSLCVAEHVLVIRCDWDLVVVRTIYFSPNETGHEISPPEHLIHQYFQIVTLAVIDAHPDGAILAEQLTQQFQTRPHHGEPFGMFQRVIIMLEGAAGVVGRIDIDALHLPGVEGQQGF